jgi:hypothetical protein
MAFLNTIHVIPLQLTLRPDLRVYIACDDPRAVLDPSTGVLTINLAPNPANPRPGLEGVRFVVREFAPQSGTVYHTTMLTGALGLPLIPWQREGDVMRSPYIPVGASVDLWSTVLAIPSNPLAAKVYQGRRTVKIDAEGGGDLTILTAP